MEERERTGFPEGFLWGSASASYQVEGGYQGRRICGSSPDLPREVPR